MVTQILCAQYQQCYLRFSQLPQTTLLLEGIRMSINVRIVCINIFLFTAHKLMF